MRISVVLFIVCTVSLLAIYINNSKNEKREIMNQDCIFCKIISGQIPSKIIEETDDIIVIKDIQPKALVHYLIIPKKHIANIQSCTSQDQALLGSMLLMAQKLSQSLAGSQEFKLISNNGASVGQSVFHIHMHFLSGSSFQKYEV
jgi:histidine triad (HIT) family protein